MNQITRSRLEIGDWFFPNLKTERFDHVEPYCNMQIRLPHLLKVRRAKLDPKKKLLKSCRPQGSNRSFPWNNFPYIFAPLFCSKESNGSKARKKDLKRRQTTSNLRISEKRIPAGEILRQQST